MRVYGKLVGARDEAVPERSVSTVKKSQASMLAA
jgi:hypothetical protein